jgi:hypothetical protein
MAKSSNLTTGLGATRYVCINIRKVRVRGMEDAEIDSPYYIPFVDTVSEDDGAGN